MNKKGWCFLGVHEYEIIEKGPYEGFHECRYYSVGSYFHLRCKVCGKIIRAVVGS